NHSQLYLLAFAFVIGQTLLVTWFYQGIEKMYYIAITSLIARLIFVALVFIFIRNRQDNSYFLFFMGLGNVVGGLGGIYAAIRVFKIKYVKPLWPDIIH